jgi:hypothetical protein
MLPRDAIDLTPGGGGVPQSASDRTVYSDTEPQGHTERTTYIFELDCFSEQLLDVLFGHASEACSYVQLFLVLVPSIQG